MKTPLREVSPSRPCPVCNGGHKCSHGEDGLILCGRASGERPGFIHLGQAKGDGQFAMYRSEGDPALNGKPAPNRPRGPSKVAGRGESARKNGKADDAADWTARAEAFRQALTPTLRGELAKAIGLPTVSLDALGVGWCEREKCWTFPERDGAGRVVGVGRRFRDESKRAMAGGARGLSIPDDWRRGDGPVFLPEGPSDTAALAALGLAGVGRPNNTGGAEQLAELLRGLPAARPIIVLGENDAKQSGDWPGRNGAEKTAARLGELLGRPIAWALPPVGDKGLRAWVQKQGLNPARPGDGWEDAGRRFAEALQPNRAAPAGAASRRKITPEPYRAFPVHALPKPVGDFVQQGADALGCDPSYLALPALAVMAAAIGNTRVIRLKATWREPSVVWAAVVGDSGTVKSPAHRMAASHLFRLQSGLIAEYEEKLRRWREDRRSGEAGSEDEPICRRLACRDVTIERLADILADNPRGVLVSRDELGGWVSSFVRYRSGGGTDLPQWLEMFRAETLVVDRKTGGRPLIHVPRAAVSVVGTIQPGTLARALTAEHLEAGLGARLLLAMPPKRPKRWTEAEIAPDVRKAYEETIEQLLELSFAVERGKRGEAEQVPHAVALTPEAKAAWVAFYDAWAVRQNGADGELAAVYSKLEGYAARFALIHYIVSHLQAPAVGEAEPARGPVGPESIQAGAELARWFADEAIRIYALLNESADDRRTRRLIELIQSWGGEATARRLHKSNPAKYRTPEDAEVALEKLAEAGVAEWAERPPSAKGGRPTRVLRLIPAPAPPKPDETPSAEDASGETPPDETPDETPADA